MPPHELLAAASLAYLVTHIGGTEGLRALASAWEITGKLTTCAFCTGFWAAGAVHAAVAYPWEVFSCGLAGALIGALLAVGAMQWGERVVWPAAQLGALLAVLGAGVALPLLDGATPSAVAFHGLCGALVSLGAATAINAGMAYAARADVDSF